MPALARVQVQEATSQALPETAVFDDLDYEAANIPAPTKATVIIKVGKSWIEKAWTNPKNKSKKYYYLRWRERDEATGKVKKRKQYLGPVEDDEI